MSQWVTMINGVIYHIILSLSEGFDFWWLSRLLKWYISLLWAGLVSIYDLKVFQADLWAAYFAETCDLVQILSWSVRRSFAESCDLAQILSGSVSSSCDLSPFWAGWWAAQFADTCMWSLTFLSWSVSSLICWVMWSLSLSPFYQQLILLNHYVITLTFLSSSLYDLR